MVVVLYLSIIRLVYTQINTQVNRSNVSYKYIKTRSYLQPVIECNAGLYKRYFENEATVSSQSSSCSHNTVGQPTFNACQVRVTVGVSGLCCCVCFER